MQFLTCLFVAGLAAASPTTRPAAIEVDETRLIVRTATEHEAFKSNAGDTLPDGNARSTPCPTAALQMRCTHAE